MPELPEVETLRRSLRDGRPDRPSIVGRKIEGVHILWARTIETPDPLKFAESIVGQVIADVQRRGKYFVIPLSSDTLLIHLRMSGDLYVELKSDQIAQHHRLIFNLDNRFRIAFNNPRKFGRVWLVDNPEKILGNLGPEPLDPKFMGIDFHTHLQRHRRQLKALLLDQHFLAGLGNIYTDEALFCAGLHPKTIASTLTLSQSETLFRCIRDVLQEGITQNGASIDWVYRGGEFQNMFQVYQRTDQPCYRCGTNIERILVAQRGTHFCPSCQPLKGT